MKSMIHTLFLVAFTGTGCQFFGAGPGGSERGPENNLQKPFTFLVSGGAEEPALACRDEKGAIIDSVDLKALKQDLDCEPYRYYQSIDPRKQKATLDDFKAFYGFNRDNKSVRAVYQNAYDLGFIRDMWCRTAGTSRVACYVTNYRSFADQKAGKSLATVAMDYDPQDLDNTIKFYTYGGGTGDRYLFRVDLDGEGPKATPQVCVSCHGGKYDPATASVSQASFIAFDPNLFKFDTANKLGHEVFNALNALVKKTEPAAAVLDYIEASPTAEMEALWVPEGWSDTEQDVRFYRSVIKPFCRNCHVTISKADSKLALDSTKIFKTYLPTILDSSCGGYQGRKLSMPHAKLTFDLYTKDQGPRKIEAYAQALGFKDFRCPDVK